jgi:SAM-dependent methyltransferase
MGNFSEDMAAESRTSAWAAAGFLPHESSDCGKLGGCLPAPPSPDLLGLHRQNNRESAALWDDFGDHRARVTALAIGSAPVGGAGTIAVLGAGNCNDLDLAALTAHFAEVHLVDLDEEALARARSRQAPEVAAKLVLHAPVDLSGAFARLGGFRHKPATPVELATLPQTCVDSVTRALPETFDVVASTCFLSQLMQSAAVSLGENHPQLHLLACALALAHLRSIARLLRPGGIGHVVTDTVTTETYPLVELWGQRSPLGLLDHLELTNNVFSGTGPSFLRRILATDKQVAAYLAGSPRLLEPWLWRFTEDRTYLVYALTFERAHTDR